MTWFDKSYEVDNGSLVVECFKCGDILSAYTPKSLGRKKKAHKPECRQRRRA